MLKPGFPEIAETSGSGRPMILDTLSVGRKLQASDRHVMGRRPWDAGRGPRRRAATIVTFITIFGSTFTMTYHDHGRTRWLADEGLKLLVLIQSSKNHGSSKNDSSRNK